MRPTRCRYCGKMIHWFVKKEHWYPFEDVHFWNLHDCYIDSGGKNVRT